MAELVRLTKENVIPEETMILALFYNTQAGYYLPDYLVYCPLPLIFSDSEVPIEKQNVYVSFQRQTRPKTYWIPTDFHIEPIPIQESIKTLLIWEEEIAEYYQDTHRPLEVIESDRNDTKIYFLKVRPGEKIDYNYHSWSVK